MIKFSILIPSIPERFGSLKMLWDYLSCRVEDKPVEILAFTDNKKRSIGLKRDALVQSANGQYLAFVDDDDEVYDCYVDSILEAIDKAEGADVISIQQDAILNGGNKFLVDFSIGYENQQVYEKNGIWQPIKRKPFHTCVWKTEIAKRHKFADASYGEDWHWCRRVLVDVKREYKINKPLLCYHFSDSVTAAEYTFPKEGE